MNENNSDSQIALDAQIMPNTITSLITAPVVGEELPDLIRVNKGCLSSLMKIWHCYDDSAQR